MVDLSEAQNRVRAAGVMLMGPDGRVLLLCRAAASDHAGEWCFPGGCIEDGESAADAAARECLEETGYRIGVPGQPFATRDCEGVHFTTFLVRCEDEFVPKLNEEHTAFAWMRPVEALAATPTAVPAPVAAL